VALSTIEAEYIAASVASREAVWLQKLLAGLFDLELEPTLIYCDNQSCVKHIEIKYHYIQTWCREELWSSRTYPQMSR
jgi:hypothetical protein